MSDIKKHIGSCHCGKVRYEVTTALQKVISCNCSICAKKGYLLAFVPEKDFTLLAGEETLTDYQFHQKKIHHLFCSVCGVSSFGKGVGSQGQNMYAVNVRCLDDVNLDTLAIVPFDGRSR